MDDEDDITASASHSIPAANSQNPLANEGHQRQLDLQLATSFTAQKPVTNGDFSQDKYVAYTIKLPAHQLAALQSIWLELKRLYGAHSPDKSGMIQHAVEEWLKRWDGSDRDALLDSLLQIRADTRRRQYKKSP